MLRKLTNDHKNSLKSTYLGRNIKFLRRLKGLSQKELAEKLNLKRGNIASYESGLVEPNMNNLLKISSFFSVPPTALLQEIMVEKALELKANNISIDPLMDTIVNEQIRSFTIQTNHQTKILEGYRAFYEIRKSEDVNMVDHPLCMTLEQILELFDTLIKSNWALIQCLTTNDEKEVKDKGRALKD